MLAADWATPAQAKGEIKTASVLRGGRVVFHIAGNKHRIVVWINCPYRVVYVRFIGTHGRYDAIDTALQLVARGLQRDEAPPGLEPAVVADMQELVDVGQRMPLALVRG